MEELKSYIETAIALMTKHIAEDESWKDDAINGQFNRGRLAAEKYDLDIVKKIADMVNKL